MDTSRCSDCGDVLTSDNTYKTNKRTCKKCLYKRTSKRMQERTDRREYAMWANAKHRAKRDGLPFDITPKDIVIPEACPVLGIPFSHNTSRGALDNSPTLDKIIPEMGYVRGNIAVMSAKANRIKNDASLADLAAVTRWMLAVSP